VAGSELFVLLAKVEVEVYLALSCRIRSISRFLVSENWVAMTTRHRLIMKNEPIYKHSGRKQNPLELVIRFKTNRKPSEKFSRRLTKNKKKRVGSRQQVALCSC